MSSWIDDRECLQSELRQANRYFELARDLMVTSSADGYFKSVNPAVEHILGWSAEEFLARPFIDMVHPDDRAATLAEVAKLATGQITLSFVNRYQARDGSYRWLDWNAIVPPDEELMYASARDVTDNKLAEAALAKSEARTREILASAADAFVAMDAGGVIIDWNIAAQAAFGWTREEALGRELAETIIPDRRRAAHRILLQRLLANGTPQVANQRLERSALHRDGHEFPIELTIARRRTDSGYALNAFVRDLSDRRAAEEETRQSRALSERLLRAQDAISRVFAQAQSSEEAMRELLAALGQAMDWELGAWWARDDDELLRCRSVWHRETPAQEFEALSRQLAFARGIALPGRVWVSGRPDWSPDLAGDPSFPRANVAAGAGLHASVCVPVLAGQEFRGAIEFFSTQTGEPDLPTRQILSTVAEQIGGFMTVLDQRADAVAKLTHLALTDALTGLANWRAWQESLDREIARAKRHGQPLCVAMLDLDHFKDFNDAHGHQAGDQLLREIARIWRAQLRATDILARYGGEEFAVAFHASPLHVAAKVLARVRAGVPRQQTCSAGLAEFDGSETAQDLLGRADAALYAAKAQGRNRIVIAARAAPGA